MNSRDSSSTQREVHDEIKAKLLLISIQEPTPFGRISPVEYFGFKGRAYKLVRIRGEWKFCEPGKSVGVFGAHRTAFIAVVHAFESIDLIESDDKKRKQLLKNPLRIYIGDDYIFRTNNALILSHHYTAFKTPSYY